MGWAGSMAMSWTNNGIAMEGQVTIRYIMVEMLRIVLRCAGFQSVK